MADGRKNNGGARKGAGRKPKSAALELIERFDRIINEDDVVRSLKKLIDKGDHRAIKTYFEYRYGQPHKTVDITSGDNPIQNFNLSKLSDSELEVLMKIHDGGSNIDTDDK